MRGDLGELSQGDEALAELQLLLARRRGLVADRTRAVTRLRGTLLALFPALEWALNLNTRGPAGARSSRSPATRPQAPSAGRGAIGSPRTSRSVA